MRALAVVAGVWGWLGLADIGSCKDDSPYVALVVADQAVVRCGPGYDFYATAELKRGDKVEVYRQDPHGWLAIRPPEGNFSWVNARCLDPTEDSRVSRVNCDEAVAWVGSSQGKTVSHRWQVRLKPEELVEVLGRGKLAPFPGAAEEPHVQIAPPAGEFRWIHRKQVATTEALEKQSQLANAERAKIAELQVVVGETPPHLVRLKELTERVRQAAAEEPATVSEMEPATDSETPEAEPAQDDAEVEMSDAATTAAVEAEFATEPIDVSPPPEDLLELEVKLTQMAARDPREWQLGSLRQAAQTFATTGTEADRVRARQALSRIEEFGRLRAKAMELAARTPTTSAATGAVRQASAATSAPDYTGTGWLMPVHSTRRPAPPFALLDGQGNLKCYVTPTPGMNLNRYARTEVGVFGEKGHIPALKAGHITVQRVVSLSRHSPKP